MSKLGVAAATMGVGGTGAAGTYTAYSLGAFGGGGTALTGTHYMGIFKTNQVFSKFETPKGKWELVESSK